jgi:DNA-binding response OmpR family regulator
MAASSRNTTDRRRGRTIQVAGRDVYLTPTEHRLWETLRRMPGRTCTRSELLEAAVPDAIVSDRTIDVHIASIRTKLGDARACIETVARLGYRFVDRSDSHRKP